VRVSIQDLIVGSFGWPEYPELGYVRAEHWASANQNKVLLLRRPQMNDRG